MERREVLKVLASAAVLPAISPEAFSLFRGIHAQIAQGPGLKTLNAQQDATVTTIAELIIPQTDTPGAKAVKVNQFIDLILSEWYDAPDTARFLAGLADVDARCQNLYGKRFTECAESQQTEILSALDEEALVLLRTTVADTTESAAIKPTGNFFQMMKKLTLIGYYTSEVGFEEELHASIIPPTHAGCAPIPEELTK